MVAAKRTDEELLESLLAASEAFAAGKRGQLCRENTFLTQVHQRLLRRLVPIEGVFREQALDE